MASFIIARHDFLAQPRVGPPPTLKGVEMAFAPVFGGPFASPFGSSFSPTKFEMEKPIGGHLPPDSATGLHFWALPVTAAS
jgi:hypothetical protein